MNQERYSERKKMIVNTSWVNIIGTLILATVKVVVGYLANSTAMIVDAINYYNDVVNSAVVLIGAVLSDRKPDRKHPFGYGRIEYLSTLLLSLLLLYAAIQTAIGAVKGVLHPVEPHYTIPGVIVVAATLVVKYFIGHYTAKNGKAAASDALTSSGGAQIKKARFSLLTLLVILIYMFTKVSLDRYLSLVIAYFVMKGAIKLLMKTISNLVGRREQADFSKNIKKTIASFDQVLGAYDLVLHNYGPERMQGTVHIEIPDTMSLKEFDSLQRHIVKKVLKEHDVVLTAVGCYAVNTYHDHMAEIREELRGIVIEHGALAMHGFYMNTDEKEMSFDAVYDFDNQERFEQYKKLKAKVKEMYPEYQIELCMDMNFTD